MVIGGNHLFEQNRTLCASTSLVDTNTALVLRGQLLFTKALSSALDASCCLMNTVWRSFAAVLDVTFYAIAPDHLQGGEAAA
jgi:hypothetical protein